LQYNRARFYNAVDNLAGIGEIYETVLPRGPLRGQRRGKRRNG
jgi:hypothetical protein